MADHEHNPLEAPDAAMAQRIRERAYHLWEADGSPDDAAEEYWARAEILTRMEEAPHAGELPNPATQPGADPLRTQIVEEASIQKTSASFRIVSPTRATARRHLQKRRARPWKADRIEGRLGGMCHPRPPSFM